MHHNDYNFIELIDFIRVTMVNETHYLHCYVFTLTYKRVNNLEKPSNE